MRNATAAIILSLTLALSGCAALQQNPPDTPTESLAYVYATIDSVANSTTSALDRGAIETDTAKDIRDQLERADGIADDAAVLIEAGKTADAEERIATAESLMTRIEKRLAQEVENE